MDWKLVDTRYYYDGNDLGVTYSKENCVFKLWSPYAKDVKLILDDNFYPMEKKKRGVWSLKVSGDYHGEFYNFYISQDGKSYEEIVDPYAKSLSVNGKKGAIINHEVVSPKKWNDYNRSYDDSINPLIYELHIRDITIDENSNIKHPGKFLGLAEKNSLSEEGFYTGLSHIKSLGVTHIQLMPIYDFATVDETKNKEYNWGYDPLNFNSPDGSYSTDPYDPTTRVLELKEMIQAIHSQGLKVVMDVVYNHVYHNDKINFEMIFPDYYFRKKKSGKFYNGSGCGNEVASERKMVRKFIVDSVKYWAVNYHIDGFRFDLMGLLDIETMNQIRLELDKIDDNIIILGEGWEMGEALPFENKACLWNAKYLPNIAQFNDDFRDGMRGNNFEKDSLGYISGDFSKKINILRGIVGGIEYSDKIKHLEDICPNQIVNYVEVHDNHTLYDKLKFIIDDENKLKKAHILATTITILSQGITLIHSGQEIMRTKNGEDNTYNMGDEINKFDWNRKKEFMDVFKYIKKLIKIKKQYASFNFKTRKEIIDNMEIFNTPDNIIAYKLENNNDSCPIILVIHNASEKKDSVDIHLIKKWKILLKDKKYYEGDLKEKNDHIFEIEGYDTIIAYAKA